MAAIAKFPLSVVVGAVDRLTGPMTRMEGRVTKFGRNVSRIGRGLTLGLTAPIIGLGAAALNVGIDFETGMTNVQALTGATKEALEPLRQQAKDLGRDMIFTAGQATEGMGRLALAGLELNEIFGATPTVLNLAAAANLGMADAATFSLGVLRGQQFQLTELNRVVDGLTKGFTGSQNELVDLVEALVETGPALAGSTTTFEDQLALLATLAAGAKKGAVAGTALRNVALNLVRPTATARASIKALGLSVEELQDTTGAARNLIEVFEMLAAAGAGPGELFDIFGKKAFTVAKILASNVEVTRAFGVSMRDNVGRTAEIAALKMSTTAGSMFKLKSAAEALGIAVAEAGLQESFKDLVDALTAWVKGLSEADKEHLKNATTIGGVVAAAGPLLVALGALSFALVGVIKFLKLFAKPIKWVAGLLVRFLIPAIIRFGAWILLAFAITPVGIWVAAIAAAILVGKLLAKHWHAIQDTAVRVWKSISGAIVGAITTITRALLDFVIPDPIERLLGLDFSKTKPIATGPAGAGDVGPLGSATGPGGLGGAGGEARVRIAFDNLPSIARVTAEGDADLDMDLGFAMVSA